MNSPDIDPRFASGIDSSAGDPDVVILGGGLAGLTLARQLLLGGERRILLLDRQPELPGKRQKVGESSVQLAGHYLAKVLGLEEHLLYDHFMKYNLRFYWPAPGRPGTGLEDYSQAYIRKLSNVPSYQLDRNRLEEHLFELNREHPSFTAVLGVADPEVELAPAGDPAARHRVRWGGVSAGEARCRWVVDATGRNRALARRLELTDSGRIRHGTFFLWVEGLVDVEKLTGLSPAAARNHPSRRELGHMPQWLATNHFMGDGLWLWVIPLRGKTSIGVVYDRATFDHREVAGPDKLVEWICREFPCFARDLPGRRVVDWGGFKDFAHDSRATIDAARWAVTGVAGRFHDPLYSPGSDLIAIHNTLIAAAIEAPDDELASRCALAERQMQAVFGAYVPSYAESYQVLGDPEAFSLKYGWELAVYFAFYVFPFLNDLFTDRRFALAHLRLFARLGPINHGVQKLLAGYHAWKREHPGAADPPGEPVYFDFTRLEPLARAETAFYEIGVGVEAARTVLSEQLESLAELARFVAAHVASRVLGEGAAVRHRGFVEGLDPARLRFDPDAWRAAWKGRDEEAGDYAWSFDPAVMDVFVAEEEDPEADERIDAADADSVDGSGEGKEAFAAGEAAEAELVPAGGGR